MLRIVCAAYTNESTRTRFMYMYMYNMFLCVCSYVYMVYVYGCSNTHVNRFGDNAAGTQREQTRYKQTERSNCKGSYHQQEEQVGHCIRVTALKVPENNANAYSTNYLCV